jgi:hypothetical protein
MPKLTYGDVFLPEKEDVMDKIQEMEQQVKALTFAIVKSLVDSGTRSIRVDRESFAEQMAQENIEEPINLVFRGSKDYFIVSIEE